MIKALIIHYVGGPANFIPLLYRLIEKAAYISKIIFK